MNTYIIVIFAAVVAMAAAGWSNGYNGYGDDSYGYQHHGGYNDYQHHGGYNGYQQGLRKVHNGLAAPYNNAARQAGVNYVAEKVGASSGTARYYGVPGTGRNFGYSGYGNRYPSGRYGGY